MKLIDLKLTNFRKLSNLPQQTITFHEDINVLVGTNNAGKTSILKAIQKLFNAEGVDEKDLNYLVKDGNLIIEANIKISKEQWQSYLRVALGQQPQMKSDAVNTDKLAEELYNFPINIKHNIPFVKRKQSNPRYPKTGELHSDGIAKVATDNNKLSLILEAIRQLANSNFYNVYKTPLYLDSKGEIKEYEPFVALNEIENQRNIKQINIRGLLYSLKKKEPKKFENFKKRILEIFTELEDIDIINNEDLGRFELVFREKLLKNGTDEEVSYDINNVGQGMQSLVIILSTILLLKPSIVLMDEPEVHMHPSLIREFVKYIKLLSSETQFIISTHSVIMMNEIGLDKTFSLKNEVAEKGIIVSKVDNRNKLFETINSLGYNIDALTYTIKPAVFVFTEGPSDKDLILAFAYKAGLSNQINAFTTAFIPMDGKGNRYKLANLIDKLNKEFIDSPLIMILDKDETSHSTIEEIRQKFFSKNPKRLHYLSQRQIENYLIDNKAISKVVGEKIKNELLNKWKNENILNKILQLSDEQKEKISNNYLSELFINESLINTKDLGSILKALGTKPLKDSVREFSAEIAKFVTLRTYDLGQKTTSAIEEFEKNWNTAKNKVEMCDGRDLLTAIRRWIQDEYNITFSNNELIDAMENIPNEISALLIQLTKPEELKIIP
jgi:predicted ATP-dependent endonuclease of OLD family